MSLGEKLLSLRKKKGLSQEEVADLLHVTRQTVSKWETDQSTPDFDKVVPICKLYDISTEELFGEVAVREKEVINSSNDVVNYREYNQKKALYTTLAVMLYILSIVVIIFFSVVLRSPIVGVCVFFLVIAIATGMLIYIEMTKPMMRENISKKEKKTLTKMDKLYKQITSVLALFVLAIYLIISVLTMRWDITWILWIIYALATEIIKLVFSLKGVEIHEEE